MNRDHWNDRYAATDFAYGTEPNEFLVSVAQHLPPGPVLMLADGEGRNGVYVAGRGYEVVSVDQSEMGLAKARRLAEQRGVRIQTQQADLREYRIEPESWAGIVSIFCHLPPAIRVPLHAAVVRGLQSGGVYILEAYNAAQCGRGTGGPSDPQWMPSLDQLKCELAGLEFLHAQELEREVREGSCHTGLASVVQIVARKDAGG
jgi:hypothetical protein